MTDEAKPVATDASAVPPTRSARGYPKPFASRVAGAGPAGWATSLAGRTFAGSRTVR
jgi:hypothetical protein